MKLNNLTQLLKLITYLFVIKLIEFAKKIDNLSNDIIELKTEEGRKVYSDALSLLSKVSAFIREKAEQL